MMGLVRGPSVLLAVALGASSLLVACGGDDEPAGVAASGPLGEAVIEPARRTLVPAELPDGMTLQLVDEDSGGHSDGYVRLYGEADATEPLEGPLVAAMWQWFAGDGSLPVGEPRWPPPPDEVDQFGGQPAVSGTEGPVRWTTWMVPNGTEDPGSAGVVGRGLSEDELRAAAEGLEFDSEGYVDGELDLAAQPSPSDPDWIGTPRLTPSPPGLVELASGRLSLSGLDVGYAPSSASVLEWHGDDTWLTVATYAHDDALALLLRAGVDDPDGTEIRGYPGAHGPAFAPSLHGNATEVWTWTEDGMDIVVLARGLSAADGQMAVDSLRASADWDGLTAEASAPPPREAGPGEILMQDAFPGGSWAISITCRSTEQADRGFRCDDSTEIRHADGSHGAGGGGSLITDAAWLSISGDEAGILLDGTVTPAIEMVEVELADGSVLRPEMRDGGDGWPIRAWALWVSDPEAVVTDLRGFDRSGRQRFSGVAAELAEISQPKSPGGSRGTRIAVDP